jgi:hypothetical protein
VIDYRRTLIQCGRKLAVPFKSALALLLCLRDNLIIRFVSRLSWTGANRPAVRVMASYSGPGSIAGSHASGFPT